MFGLRGWTCERTIRRVRTSASGILSIALRPTGAPPGERNSAMGPTQGYDYILALASAFRSGTSSVWRSTTKAQRTPCGEKGRNYTVFRDRSGIRAGGSCSLLILVTLRVHGLLRCAENDTAGCEPNYSPSNQKPHFRQIRPEMGHPFSFCSDFQLSRLFQLEAAYEVGQAANVVFLAPALQTVDNLLCRARIPITGCTDFDGMAPPA